MSSIGGVSQLLEISQDQLSFSGLHLLTAFEVPVFTISATAANGATTQQTVSVSVDRLKLTVISPQAGAIFSGLTVPISITSNIKMASAAATGGGANSQPLQISTDQLSASGQFTFNKSGSQNILISATAVNGTAAQQNIPILIPPPADCSKKDAVCTQFTGLPPALSALAIGCSVEEDFVVCLPILGYVVGSAKATFASDISISVSKLQVQGQLNGLYLQSGQTVAVSAGGFTQTLTVAPFVALPPQQGASSLSSFMYDRGTGVYYVTLLGVTQWQLLGPMPFTITTAVSPGVIPQNNCSTIQFEESQGSWSFTAPPDPQYSCALGLLSATPDSIMTTDSLNVTVTLPTAGGSSIDGNTIQLFQIDSQYNKQGGPLCTLVDDGTNGDAVARDGIYSCQITYTNAAAGTFRFMAEATSGGQLVRSSSKVLQIVGPLTADRELATSNAVSSAATSAYSMLLQYGDNTTARQNALAAIRTNPGILKSGIDNKTGDIWIHDQDGGVTIIQLTATTYDDKGSGAGSGGSCTPPSPLPISSTQPSPHVPPASFLGKSAMIWSAFDFEFSSAGGNSAPIVANMLKNYSCGSSTNVFRVDYEQYQNGGATVASLSNMANYDVVYLGTHGGFVQLDDSGTPVGGLLTHQNASVQRTLDFPRSMLITRPNGRQPYLVTKKWKDESTYYIVTADYIRDFIPSFKKPALVFISGCAGFGDDSAINGPTANNLSIVTAFLANGASAVLGYHNDVPAVDDVAIVQKFFTHLLEAPSNSNYAYTSMLADGSANAPHINKECLWSDLRYATPSGIGAFAGPGKSGAGFNLGAQYNVVYSQPPLTQTDPTPTMTLAPNLNIPWDITTAGSITVQNVGCTAGYPLPALAPQQLDTSTSSGSSAWLPAGWNTGSFDIGNLPFITPGDSATLTFNMRFGAAQNNGFATQPFSDLLFIYDINTSGVIDSAPEQGIDVGTGFFKMQVNPDTSADSGTVTASPTTWDVQMYGCGSIGPAFAPYPTTTVTFTNTSKWATADSPGGPIPPGQTVSVLVPTIANVGGFEGAWSGTATVNNYTLGPQSATAAGTLIGPVFQNVLCCPYFNNGLCGTGP